jgi:hypothetical protein
MNASAPSELLRAIHALWGAGKLTPGNLYETPAFITMREVCQANYTAAGSDQLLKFALSQALYNLGFRWTAEVPSQHAVPAFIAAERIDAAFRQKRSQRIHICALDQADELPLLRFGPNSIRRFTAYELDELFDPDGSKRKIGEWAFDSRRFC